MILTIKGERMAKEIVVTFSTVNSDEIQPNGPNRFWLKAGQLFRLYLKKGDGNTYVGVLDGDYDDGDASMLLLNN